MNQLGEIPSRGSLFLFLFTNRTFLCTLALLWFAFSIYLSVRTKDWSWFSRSGAILCIIGAVLSCRSVLRLTPQERIRIRNMNIVEVFSESEKAEQERDSSAVIIGVSLLVSGTIIWAYGDLLSRFCKYAA